MFYKSVNCLFKKALCYCLCKKRKTDWFFLSLCVSVKFYLLIWAPFWFISTWQWNCTADCNIGHVDVSWKILCSFCKMDSVRFYHIDCLMVILCICCGVVHMWVDCMYFLRCGFGRPIYWNIRIAIVKHFIYNF